MKLHHQASDWIQIGDICLKELFQINKKIESKKFISELCKGDCKFTKNSKIEAHIYEYYKTFITQKTKMSLSSQKW